MENMGKGENKISLKMALVGRSNDRSRKKEKNHQKRGEWGF